MMRLNPENLNDLYTQLIHVFGGHERRASESNLDILSATVYLASVSHSKTSIIPNLPFPPCN